MEAPRGATGSGPDRGRRASLLVAAPAADAHSLIRMGGGEVAYLSPDAVSLNTLIVGASAAEIDSATRRSTAGSSSARARPGEVTDDGNRSRRSARPPARAATDRPRRPRGHGDGQVGLPVTHARGHRRGQDDHRGRRRRGRRRRRRRRVDAGDGDDQVNAGDGDDEVDGGPGDDVVEAGLGVDTVDGGDGNDDLRVRDGIADAVRCGDGEDTVDADTLDDVALDCENVSRLPTPVPEGGGTTGRDRDAAEGPRRRPTVQRAAARPLQLVATSSERGTISASGFIDVAGLSLPISADRQRVGVGGGGVELTVKLPARRCARRPARGGAGAARDVRLGVVGDRPRRQLRARPGAGDPATSLAAPSCAPTWRCPPRRARAASAWP